MEPEGSLPHSQEPAACPYSEPDQSTPCHIPLLENPFNIILPSTPGSSQWSLSLRFPYQNPLHTSLSYTCYMSCPSQSSFFDRPNNIWWGVQTIKLLIMEFSPLRVASSLLAPNILLSTLFSDTLSQLNRQTNTCTHLVFYLLKLIWNFLKLSYIFRLCC